MFEIIWWFVCRLVCLFFFWREKFKGLPPSYVCQKVARGNAVQFCSNFPAKSLSIYRANFWMTLVINLIEFQLSN